MADALLPFVDVHSVDTAASPEVVWDTLLGAVPAARTSWLRRAWSALWGADPAESNGLAPHVLGAERPGLVVCEVVRLTTYALAGTHRFARYQLVFRLAQRWPTGCRLSAETFADFPGVAGRVYRWLLIDTGVHGLVVRLMLRRIGRRAESVSRRAPS